MANKKSTLENLVKVNRKMFNELYKDKTVLVTGHTGFQGGWLSLWLKKLGANVIGYSLEPPTEPSFFESVKLNEELEHIIGDIRDESRINEIITEFKPEIIFHLAAQSLVRESYNNPIETFETNILGTANILESVRRSESVRAVMIMTSDKCYDNKEFIQPHKETDPMGGFDPYSASKGATELITASYRDSFFKNNLINCGIATARSGNVIGGGDWSENRIIPDSIKKLTNDNKIMIRNPESKRPWQYVLESISGILWLTAKLYQEPEKFDQGWNFGPNKNSDILTVKELVKKIIKEWDSKQSFMIDKKSSLLHESEILLLDSSKSENELGWRNIFKIDELISETISWYKMHNNKTENMKEFSLKQIEKYSMKATEDNLVWTN